MLFCSLWWNKPLIVRSRFSMTDMMNKTAAAHSSRSSRLRKSYPWVFLGLTLCMALWIRLDDLIAWQRLPQKAFHAERPLLVTFDGYYYLALARDLMNDAYTPQDHLRGVPDPVMRPHFPPLISLIAARLSMLTSISLDWVAILLPPLLGILLAIPLYLFGRLYGGTLMALVATFLGLCSSYYAYRSNLGWFDTDCMNVTFAMMIAYLFIQFGLQTGPRRYYYLTGGGLCTLAFLMWWDQTPASVLIISLAPLFFAVTLFYRPKGKELWIVTGVTFMGIVTLLTWQGPQFFGDLYRQGLSLFGYITKAQVGDFPNIGASIFEQKRLAFDDLVQRTSGHVITFAIGVFGLGWLFWARKREAAALGILFVLGCFSFLYARRFLIFLNPFIAIGTGYVVHRLWQLRQKWSYWQAIVPVLAVLLCISTVAPSFGKVFWPKEIPPITEGIERLNSLSPEDAVIWAWWDHGYPIVYWGQRATINDGSLHSGLRTVCNAIPLSSHSQSHAANFMHFYVSRGTRGMKNVFEAVGSSADAMVLIEKVLSADPESVDTLLVNAGLTPVDEWRRFFFAEKKRHLYLFLDLRLARTTYWWHWFGTWRPDEQRGDHPKFELIRNLRMANRRIRGVQLEVNLEQGLVSYRKKTYRLGQFYLKNGSKLTHATYGAANGLVFAFRSDDGVGALMEPGFSNTVFNQLFVLSKSQSPYFTMVAEYYPYYQIWRVSAD